MRNNVFSIETVTMKYTVGLKWALLNSFNQLHEGLHSKKKNTLRVCRRIPSCKFNV